MANNIHFDFLAPIYEQFIRMPDTTRLKTLLDLPASGWLLDAGGGTGRVAAALCPLVDRLLISDLSFRMLAQVRRKSKQPACQNLTAQASVTNLPYPDGHFSRILVVDAFHHFSDQPGALRELARVLAPGGRLVIEEPDIRSFGVKVIALAEKIALMDSHFRKPGEIALMAAKQGLTSWVEGQHATAWVVAEKPLPQTEA